MLDPIDSYLNDILAPQIAKGNLKGHPAIKTVTDDIRKRLRSLLSRWADVEVRNTLLFIGREEANFYEPESAPLDVRALIVVGIRNSLLEELSTDYSTLLPRGTRLPLMDEDMPIITRAAIEYWRDVQLDCLSIPQSRGDDDIFGPLADQYPHAWNALFHLANTKRQSVAYPACKAPTPPVPISLTQRRDDTRRTVGLSGISSQIDPQLADYLRAIAAGTIRVFFSDSWKMLTRQPGKLYRIIDIVLANGRYLLTHNYLLTPTASYARVPVLRPAHTDREAFSKFSNLKGLIPTHRALVIATQRDLMSSG